MRRRCWSIAIRCHRTEAFSRRTFSSARVCATIGRSSDLFEYTSGKWLRNNARKQSERKRRFNVQELMILAAAAVNRPAKDVIRFEKLAEGGFNRTFLLSMHDGFQMVARVPYKVTEPKSLLVASEVATMDFLRLNDIPVPQIFGYSTTPDNPSETEYMFQEFLQETNLGDVWYDLGQNDRIAMVGRLVELETKLLSLEFPAGGSIFYSHDLEPCWDRVSLACKDSSRGEFCIGPDMTLRLWYGRRRGLKIPRNPYRNATDALVSGAQKELAYLEEFGKPLHPFRRTHREFFEYQKQSHLAYMDLLRKYLEVTPQLVPRDADLLRPKLRHPDLQPNNVFVSQDLAITSLIDWQHSAVMPIFLNAEVPGSIQNYGDPVSEALQVPRLPDDFDTLSETEQFQIVLLHRKRHLNYYYVKNTLESGSPLGKLLTNPQHILRRKIFGHSSEPWEGNNLPLKADLVDVTNTWDKLVESSSVSGSSHSPAPECPFSFPTDEKTKCLSVLAEMHEVDGGLEMAWDFVGCGSEGWVPNEVYDEAKQRAQQLLESTLKDSEEPERIRELWVFNDFDEEDYM